MNAVPASIKATSEPQVNLLPPEVEARRARGRQKGFIAFAFVAFLLVLGFGVYWATSQQAAAQDELDAVVKTGAGLEAEIATFDPVLEIQAELDNVRKARTYVGSTEVDYPSIIEEIVGATPPGVFFEDMSWSTVSIMGDTSTSLDLVVTSDVGSVQFRGRMADYATGADLEEALNEVSFLEGVRIPSEQIQQIEEAGGFYVFEGTARVNALAFTGRFSTAWLVSDEIDRAEEATEEKLKEATNALDAAKAAEIAGEEGAEEARTEAEAASKVAQNDKKQMLAIVQLVNDTEAEIASLQEAVNYGVAGVEADLLAAIADLEELRPVLDTLAGAINAWDEEAGNLATVEDRIADAEKYVTKCQDRTEDEDLLEAVALGIGVAEEAFEEAQIVLMKAQYGLAVEQSFLAAAEDAEEATRSDLDDALKAAAEVAPVEEEADPVDDSTAPEDDSTGGEES